MSASLKDRERGAPLSRILKNMKEDLNLWKCPKE